MIHEIGLMEPMMPEEPSISLEDLATDLVAKSNKLAGQLHPVMQRAVGDLVRSMNCYYSNLIEGHDTHPRDIDRALEEDFSADPRQRNLQLEAKAHIEVQRLVDFGEIKEPVVSTAFIVRLHREFCQRLPEELLRVENPDTGEEIEVVPGRMRDSSVQVGRHIPPDHDALERFLARFEEAYDTSRLSRLRQVVAVAASHHRLLWIHPFYDGNGRVTRLFSHAFLREIGVGSSLWSVSRGLARRVGEYRDRLVGADVDRRNDLDGRGTLSLEGLTAFCAFFLETCVDQVTFMDDLLRPTELLRRMEMYCEDEIRAGRLPKGAYPLLRETVLQGEFERGRAADITSYKERQARTVLNELVRKGLLVSDTPKGAVRLGFPAEVAERWFPRLYPESASP